MLTTPTMGSPRRASCEWAYRSRWRLMLSSASPRRRSYEVRCSIDQREMFAGRRILSLPVSSQVSFSVLRVHSCRAFHPISLMASCRSSPGLFISPVTGAASSNPPSPLGGCDCLPLLKACQPHRSPHRLRSGRDDLGALAVGEPVATSMRCALPLPGTFFRTSSMPHLGTCRMVRDHLGMHVQCTAPCRWRAGDDPTAGLPDSVTVTSAELRAVEFYDVQ